MDYLTGSQEASFKRGCHSGCSIVAHPTMSVNADC